MPSPAYPNLGEGVRDQLILSDSHQYRGLGGKLDFMPSPLASHSNLGEGVRDQLILSDSHQYRGLGGKFRLYALTHLPKSGRGVRD